LPYLSQGIADSLVKFYNNDWMNINRFVGEIPLFKKLARKQLKEQGCLNPPHTLKTRKLTSIQKEGSL